MPPLRSAPPGSGSSVRLREEEASVSAEVTPFRIEVPEADLVDLRERLVRTRWPEAETVDDWSQGIPLSYVRDVCRYWAGDYDWRGREAGRTFASSPARLGASSANSLRSRRHLPAA